MINVVDILAGGYFAYGVWRGRRRGFAQELPSAISWAAALLTGAGIYRWTDRALLEMGQLTGWTAGGLGFVGVTVGTIFLSRHLRKRIRIWAERRVPEERARQRAGAVVGGVRAVLITALVVLSVSALPVGPLRSPFTTGSLLGRCLNKMLRPVYELSHPPKSR